MFDIFTEAARRITARQEGAGEKDKHYKTEKTFHHSCPGKVWRSNLHPHLRNTQNHSGRLMQPER